MHRWALIGSAFTLSLVAFVACGGSADSGGTPGAGNPVMPGGSCPKLGARAPSNDGCNTCSCTQSGWACTKMACTQTCTDGQTKGAADGCNTCTCSGGQWQCTLEACVAPTCPAPAVPPTGVSCTEAIVYARSPLSGTCCMYSNACAAPEGWQQFGSQAECEQPPVVCAAGDTKPAGDGCNTCSCSENQWLCTNMACPATCADGQTRRAADGCNVCTCTNNQWGCTEKACSGQPIGCGGWLGPTCTDDEYCAYVEGEMCGATDASATCKPRPNGCTMEYAPVCGCDGKTYGNACSAASAGTGVNTTGDCPTAGI